MQNNIIPPHLHLEKVNPHINFDAIPAIVPLTPMEWKGSPDKPRLVGISSFGITGTDAHIILQEPPTITPTPLGTTLAPRPLHLLTLSSKSESGLESVLESYATFLEANPGLELSDVCYTANSGRAHFPYRVAIVGKDCGEALKKIKSSINSGNSKHVPEELPKLCWLFTGQGSQYEGMASSLYETCPTFRMHFDTCAVLLKTKFGIDLVPVIWPSTPSRENSSSPLKDSLYSQTSIFCVEYALSQLWLSWGLKPQMVVGHSLGEFAAAVAGGLLSLEDALTLVAGRSRLIQSGTKKGSMLVVKGDRNRVEGLEKEFFKSYPTGADAWLDLAAVNSSEQTVVAGPLSTVLKFSEYLTQAGVKSTVLEATNAFHSRDMDPMLEEYRRIAEKITYRTPSPGGIQYISGLTGQILSKMDASYWVRHTRDAVQFRDAAHTAWNEGGRVYLEIGPQPVLSALTMGNVADLGGEELVFLPSLRRKESDWNTILGSLAKLYVAGYNFNWGIFDQFYGRSKIPSLPFHPFNRKSFWYNQGREGEGAGAGGLTFSSENMLHPLIGESHKLNKTIYSACRNVNILYLHIRSRVPERHRHQDLSRKCQPRQVCLLEGPLHRRESNFPRSRLLRNVFSSWKCVHLHPTGGRTRDNVC